MRVHNVLVFASYLFYLFFFFATYMKRIGVRSHFPYIIIFAKIVHVFCLDDRTFFVNSRG